MRHAPVPVGYSWAVDHDARTRGVERALEALRRGDPQALPELYEMVYDELHAVARRQRGRWSGNDTIDTTALLHESFVKLLDASRFAPNDLRHFYSVAARAMRQVLLDYAQRQGARKRGGDRTRLSFLPEDGAREASQEVLAALSRAVDDLEAQDERRARVFEFRFFLGMSVAETADLLDISVATVKRDWALAAAFLRMHLAED